MPGQYDDIINLPRPVSKKHPPMPMSKRAAQFLPFAALTGFEGEIAETGRLTQAAPELGEDALVVATGGMALMIAEESKVIDKLDGLLTLKGLRLIYERNQKEGDRG